MIIINGKYFLYRHIRLDKCEPFYIGIGTTLKQPYKYETIYKRAFQKNRRNEIWRRIVAKTNYEVEVLVESDDLLFIKLREREFIALYGRIDIGTGILANLTDGADGNFNLSPECIIKRKEAAIRSGKYENSLKALRDNNLSKKGGVMPWSKELFIYNTHGNFVRRCDSVAEGSKFCRIGEERVIEARNTRVNAGGFLFSEKNHGEQVDLSLFTIRNFKDGEYVFKLTKTGRPIDKMEEDHCTVIETYKSLAEAARQNNARAGNLNRAINDGIKCGGFYWQHNSL